MAGPTSTTIVYRIRIGGNDTNGGGVDTALVVVDYSQQDSPVLTLTDITCSNTTTVTSSAGGWTPNMVGNLIWLVNGGATAGAYVIVTFTNSNSIIVDRTPGTITAGNGKVGGAWASPTVNPSNQMNNAQTCYIRGSGSNWPQGAVDYTVLSYTFTGGAIATNGAIKFIGENGRPNLSVGNLAFGLPSTCYAIFKSLYFSFVGNTNQYGVISGQASTSVSLSITNCAFEMGAYDGIACGGGNTLNTTASLVIDECEFFGSGSSGAIHTYPIIRPGNASGSNGTTITNSLFRDSLALYAVSPLLLGHISNNVIVNIKGSGIYHSDAPTGHKALLLNNTIWGCGVGVEITSSAAVTNTSIVNNIIGNNTSYGLKVDAGTAALNTKLANSNDRNLYYNNAVDYLNINAGPSDTNGVNPGFVNSSGGANTSQGGGYDFTPSLVVLGKGLSPQSLSRANSFPGAIAPSLTILATKTINTFIDADINYSDMGIS